MVRDYHPKRTAGFTLMQARTLSILSYLDQVTLVSNDPLTLQLAHVLKGFSVTMEEFGMLYLVSSNLR